MSTSAADTLVVVNPTSAGGRTGQRWSTSARVLRGLGVEHTVEMTTAPGSATDSVRAALRAGARRIVSVGGDGTLNEVVNGFFDESGAPLGEHPLLCVVTSGSGGDFGRTASLPRSPLAALRALQSGRSRAIDAGRIDFDDGTRRFFLNVADCGIGGEVVARVNRSRYKGGGSRGSAVFLAASLTALLDYRARPVRVIVDGEVIERVVQSVVVANGAFFGGGMRIAPDAQLDDGLFDVVIVSSTGRWRSIAAMPSLYRGTHVRRAEVDVRRGCQVRIEHLDRPLLFDVEGEQVGSTAATLTCLPGAVHLCVAGADGPPDSRP
ncbi:MAG: diacylglycerol/lipid kinase family protein [Candidatus Dormibacteria bacterium]